MTSEFIVEKLSTHHLECRVNWINNPLIHKHMYFKVPVDIDNTRNWFENISKNETRIDFVFKREGEIVAMGGLTNISTIDNNAEFHLMINPDLQGQGIGQKTTIWIYNYGFSVLNLNKIYLYTNEDNIGANKIYKKLELELEGVLKEHTWKNDKYNNRMIYALLKKEWEEKGWMKTIEHEL